MDIGTVGGSGVGVDDSEVDRALRQQLLVLGGVAGRLTQAWAVLPLAGGGGVWSGDARRMYVRALQQLSTQVHSACAHVDDAIRDTRHALASLAGGPHGG